MKRSIFLIVLSAALLLTGCAVGPDPSASGPGSKPNGEKKPTLTLHSFDGGGPDYSLTIEDPSVLGYEKRIEYSDPHHAEMEGAGYDVIFTFTGKKQGETKMTLSSRSPIGGNYDRIYRVTVDAARNVTLIEEETVDLDELAERGRPYPTLALENQDGRTFYAVIEENDSAQAFVELLSPGPLTLTLRENDAPEKIGELPETLPAEDETRTAQSGDLVLYEGNRLAICCGERTGEMTLLARMYGENLEQLGAILGEGDVTITLWIEWSE